MLLLPQSLGQTIPDQQQVGYDSPWRKILQSMGLESSEEDDHTLSEQIDIVDVR
jgi:hypothetical protein